ncbi:MAG TPA: hypothetical protein VF665_08470 [Longimicrobium sp.]|uniref:hypothetical protein n=1 Tax=Longimicrobium sp. TaxID=2029185 RepID=UPI002EDB5F6E
MLLILIGLGILASAIMGEARSNGLLGGAVVISGLMTRTDPKRHLRRRLVFAAAGVALMGVYMLTR